MDTGVYVNIYDVRLDHDDLSLVKADRKKYPVLKDLRQKLTKCRVYPLGDQVYGYGEDLDELRKLGFSDFKTKTYDVPQLTCSMIMEGFTSQLKDSGYKVEVFKFRRQAFNIQNPIQLSLNDVVIFPGCEFRTIFLMNPMDEKLIFGIIIDMKYRFELKGTPASYHSIRKFISDGYGEGKAHEIIREIRIKTGEMTPHGRRSSEASRFRMERIKEMVSKVNEEFVLDNGIKATLVKDPVRVIEEGGTNVF